MYGNQFHQFCHKRNVERNYVTRYYISSSFRQDWDLLFFLYTIIFFVVSPLFSIFIILIMCGFHSDFLCYFLSLHENLYILKKKLEDTYTYTYSYLLEKNYRYLWFLSFFGILHFSQRGQVLQRFKLSAVGLYAELNLVLGFR